MRKRSGFACRMHMDATTCGADWWLLLALVFLMAGQDAVAAQAQISGTATYRERMTVPPNAAFEATLEDVSRADAPADVVARTRIDSPGNPPIRFTISYDTAKIVSGHRYAVRARILVGDQLLFTTDTSYPVLGSGQQSPLQIMLHKADGNAPPTDISGSFAGLPATFTGDLPCADCEALRYHLDLLQDGSYFLRRTYVGKSPSDFDDFGRWTLPPGSRSLQLTGGRHSVERFEVRDDATLRKLDASGKPIDSSLNYEMKRQSTFAPIEPALALRGMYSYMADAGIFTECSTGKRLPVAQEADNATLEAAYSRARATPGAALLAAVQGRLSMRMPAEGRGPRTLLVVDRLISVAPGSCSDSLSTASLENTYWKLMRLGTQTVTVADQQREPHFILQPDQKRVAGSGGCNRLMGSYALNGEQLTFGQMAGTMMTCPQGMELERDFHQALTRVSAWRIKGEKLELFDAAGKSVAQLESRYLR